MTTLFHSKLIPMIAMGLLLASPAVAQTPPQNPPHPPATTPYGMMMPMMGMQGGQYGMMGMMMAHPDGSLAFLRTEIGITEAQNTLWTAYADQLQSIMKQHMDSMQKMWAPGAKPLTWVERLTAMQTGMSAHLEAMKKLVPAATALYAALTPEQKAKADAIMPGGMGMQMGMMGGGMMGTGMMGGGMPGGK